LLLADFFLAVVVSLGGMMVGMDGRRVRRVRSEDAGASERQEGSRLGPCGSEAFRASSLVTFIPSTLTPTHVLATSPSTRRPPPLVVNQVDHHHQARPRNPSDLLSIVRFDSLGFLQ
jgi:hypothetical protein